MGIFTNTPINGPINIIRLENKGKILYLLFDIHEELQFQTHCNVENSLDIDKFLAEAVKKVEGEIDFFIEASPSLLTLRAHPYTRPRPRNSTKGPRDSPHSTSNSSVAMQRQV
jgi:hypothetical protein